MRVKMWLMKTAFIIVYALMSSVNKRISPDHENYTGLNNTLNTYLIQDFIHICLDTISLQMVRSVETYRQRYMYMCIETAMHDTSSACLRSWLHEILLKFNQIFNLCPMAIGR